MATIIALWAATRLPNLTALPLHYDEASYLHWGQVAMAPTFFWTSDGLAWDSRFIATVGGKEPLHSWLVGLSALLFPDPIWAGRFVSALAGGASVFGVWLVASRLFSRPTAWLAAVIYLVLPLTLFHDRIALQDSLLGAVSVFAFYLAIRLAGGIGGWAVVGLALVAGLALLTKSSARLFLVPLPLIVLVLSPGKDLRRRDWLAVVETVAALGVGYLGYHVVFGARYGGHVDAYNAIYLLTPQELATLPWESWAGNAGMIAGWLWRDLGPPVALAGVFSLAMPLVSGRRALALVIWGGVPLAVYVFASKVLFERYLILVVIPLAILAAHFLSWLYGAMQSRIPSAWGMGRVRWLAMVLLVAVLSPAVLSDVNLLADREWALRQGLSNAPADGLIGVRNAVRGSADEGPVYLLVQRALGPVEDGSFVLFAHESSVRVLYVLSESGGLAIWDPYTSRAYSKAELKNSFVVAAAGALWPEVGRNVKQADCFANAGGDGAVCLYKPLWANQ